MVFRNTNGANILGELGDWVKEILAKPSVRNLAQYAAYDHVYMYMT